MKKLKLSLVIVLLSMVSFVGAQTPSLSIKGGLNMSNFYGDDLSDKSMKTSFHLGVGAEFGPILLDLGWDMGLVNVARDSGDEKVKNQNAYLSVGYRF